MDDPFAHTSEHDSSLYPSFKQPPCLLPRLDSSHSQTRTCQLISEWTRSTLLSRHPFSFLERYQLPFQQLSNILRNRQHLFLLQPPPDQLHADMRAVVDLRIICTCIHVSTSSTNISHVTPHDQGSAGRDLHSDMTFLSSSFTGLKDGSATSMFLSAVVTGRVQAV